MLVLGGTPAKFIKKRVLKDEASAWARMVEMFYDTNRKWNELYCAR